MSELSGEVLGAGGELDGREPEIEEPAPSHDAIARRAHEISQTDQAGTDEENWQQAERELRGAVD